MSESACLHIQDRESGPIRVMDLPWIAVRIGRSAACEVRLHDPDVPGEACRLQRRGRTWRLIPLGRKGAVFLQGEPVHEACLLPFDVPFRVGATCFTLHPDRSAEPDWSMYHAPAARTATPPPVPPAPPPPPVEPAPPRTTTLTSSPSVNPGAKAAPSVNPWEAHWRAAGARLLAQGAGQHPRPHSHSHSHSPSPSTRPRTERVPTTAPRAAEPPSRSDLRAGFTAHPLNTPTARGYPAAPIVPPRGDEIDHRPRRVEFRPVPSTPPRWSLVEPAETPPIKAEPIIEAEPVIEAEPIIEAEPVIEAGPLVVAEFDEVADVIARFVTETSGGVIAVEEAVPADVEAEEDGDLWLFEEAASAYDGAFAVGFLRPVEAPLEFPVEPMAEEVAPSLQPSPAEGGGSEDADEPRPDSPVMLLAETVAPSPQPSPAEGEGSEDADEPQVVIEALLTPSPLAAEGWGEGDAQAAADEPRS